MCIHNALQPSPVPSQDEEKKPAPKKSPPSSLGDNDLDFGYDTPMAPRGDNTRIEVPFGVSKDGKSAEAVAVITGPPHRRVPYEVLAAYAESKEKANNKDKEDSEDKDSSEELDKYLKAKV